MIYPFNIGGVELRNYELAKRLVKKHEVHMYGVKLWKGPNVIKKDGIIIHGICKYKNLYTFSGKRRIREPLIFSIALFKELIKEKFDIIDASSFVYFHCFPAKLISLIKKTPIVFTWHQYWGNYWYEYLGIFKGIIGKTIEKLSLYLTNNNLAVSKTTREDLIKNGIKRKNIKLSYNGIDIKEIKKTKKDKIEHDLIYVGRLSHQKNIGLLLESIPKIKKEFPEIKVAIIGDGPDKNNLINKANLLKIKKNVDFLGFIENKNKIYSLIKSSKIFVLPSILEGFGIVVIEAHGCGIPTVIIDSKWNASKELIDKNGLISKNNPLELSKTIKRLLKNKNLRKKLGKRAVKTAKKFDWDRITKELEKYYEKTIAKYNKS